MTTTTAPRVNWQALFEDTKTRGHIPAQATRIINRDRAIFQAMYLDLAQVHAAILASGFNPPTTTIYADVLEIPAGTSWALDGSALVIYARLINCGEGGRVLLDFRTSQRATLLLFTNRVDGGLNTYSISTDDPIELPIITAPPTGGLQIGLVDGQPQQTALTRRQGLGATPSPTLLDLFRWQFLYGGVLYDQDPAIALDMMLWLEAWSGESADLLDTFYRASGLVAQLSAEINASQNSAAFVPYLAKDVYIGLAKAFVEQARDYEAKYLQLASVEAMTERDIALAKTLLDNKTYEADYVSQVLAQARSNYTNAVAASQAAFDKLHRAQSNAMAVQIQFQDIGVPQWRRDKIVAAIITLGTAIIEFAAAIGSIFIGNPAGGVVAAGGAATLADGVAKAPETGVELKKTAAALAEVMTNLKKTLEALAKISTFLKGVIVVAEDFAKAENQMGTLAMLDVVTDGVDLSATFEWQIYQLNADAVLQGPVDQKIGFAAELRVAVDEIAVYGQALAAAQVAEVQAGQAYARIALQMALANRQQARLTQLVDGLQIGRAPDLAMMREYYLRYVDIKSSLFSAIKGYQAAYRYWALAPSIIQPRIIDSVDQLDTGLAQLTAIALDEQSALARFDPPPQSFGRKVVEITDEAVLTSLRETGAAAWTVPASVAIFAGTGRVRVRVARVWVEFAAGQTPPPSFDVRVRVRSEGNYLDRLGGVDYQFTSRPFERLFEYEVKTSERGEPDWRFANGTFGYVIVDARVDDEVKYAYFEPTPFGQWRIELSTDADLGQIESMTMALEGSLIASFVEGTQLDRATGPCELFSPDLVTTFALAPADWAALNERVEVALSMGSIAAQVAKTLPNFPDLLRVCEAWRALTFDQLIALAHAITALCSTTTTAYQMIADIVATLDSDPNRPVPEAKKQELLALIDPLASDLSALAFEVERVERALVEFVEVNQITDARLVEIQGALGPAWTTIGSEAAQVNQAAGLMRGAWGRVSADLRALAEGSIPMTTALLLGLDIEAAIRGWESVRLETIGFIDGALTQAPATRRVRRPRVAVVSAEDTLRRAFLSAAPGPMFDTTLTPTSNQGNVAVTYNWLYSALNCDPTNPQTFVWTLTKLNDTQVSLSPAQPFEGMRLYASVRPDWSDYVQVQAPHSADWIVAARGDEQLVFEAQPLMVAAFRGVNGKYLAVNPALTSHDGLSGYKIQSNGDALADSTQWFMGIQALHQPALELSLCTELSDADLAAMLATHGLDCDRAALETYRRRTP